MKQTDYDSSASGYLCDSFEGISAVFTDIEVLASSQTNIVARAKRYGRWWTLKGLQRDVAGQEAYRQRLRKEFEVLMQMQHPGVVTAIGLETVQDLGLCIVMEFLDGVTLAEWLRTETTRRQRLRVAHLLLEAIEYVHSKGIVHRDLKPENIIVTRNGEQVKLIDFGLADTDSHAILKQPAGTLHYISPEQQQTTVADVRNDIYSIGVVFSQMNIGYRRIVKKCQLQANQRYQNVGELQKAMQLHDKRRMRMAICAAIVAVILLCGISVVQTQHLQQVKSAYDDLAASNMQIKAEYDEFTSARTKVENAIREGKAALDNALQECGIAQIIDTLSYQIYLPTDYSNRINMFNNAITECVDNIGDSFNDGERLEIYNALCMYGGSIITSQMERLQKKPIMPEDL